MSAMNQLIPVNLLFTRSSRSICSHLCRQYYHGEGNVSKSSAALSSSPSASIHLSRAYSGRPNKLSNEPRYYASNGIIPGRFSTATTRYFSSYSGDHTPPAGCCDDSDFANEAEYNDVAEDTLETLTECFESLADFMNVPQEFDVNYAQGVLTAHISEEFGTYVINKQTPNRQVWLSSPVSGPKRYDFRKDRWYYGKEDETLHQLLDRALKEYYADYADKIDFSECSYSGH